MAESVFVKGGDFNPFYFGLERPITRELGDQASLAYWQMKTGTPWNPYQFVGRLGFVKTYGSEAGSGNLLGAFGNYHA